jgi:hypothetical protein
MPRSVVVRGRLHGRQIDLDEPVDDLQGEVEVVVRRPESAAARTGQSIFDFIRSMPSGSRTKEDIDQQIADERAGWSDR